MKMEWTDQFLTELCEAVEGGNSIGHQSLVVATCEKWEEEILDWDEAVLLLQEHGYDVGECPSCGWVSEEGLMETCCDEEE